MDDLNQGLQYVLKDWRTQATHWEGWHKTCAPQLLLSFCELTLCFLSSFFSNTLAIPLGVVLLFLSIQILHGIVNNVIKLWKRPHNEPSVDAGVASQWKDVNPATFHYLSCESKETSGWTIFAFNVARLAGCLVLLGLSTKTLLECLSHSHRLTTQPVHLFKDCPEVFITLTFVSNTPPRTSPS